MNDRAPSIEPSAPRSPSVTCSGQVLPRHTGGAPYRCSLPGLAGFDASRCVGPNPQRRPVRLIRHERPSKREFNPAIADCGLQGTATSPSSTANRRRWTIRAHLLRWRARPPLDVRKVRLACGLPRRLASGPFSHRQGLRLITSATRENGGGGGIRTHGTVARTRHFQCRTFGHSATPPLWPPRRRPARDSYRKKLAEGRGFEPPRDLRPYPISSRTPSTGLGHPSALDYSRAYMTWAPSR